MGRRLHDRYDTNQQTEQTKKDFYRLIGLPTRQFVIDNMQAKILRRSKVKIRIRNANPKEVVAFIEWGVKEKESHRIEVIENPSFLDNLLNFSDQVPPSRMLVDRTGHRLVVTLSKKDTGGFSTSIRSGGFVVNLSSLDPNSKTIISEADAAQLVDEKNTFFSETV